MLDPNLNNILMILQKWNPTKHIYEPFESPAKKLILISGDMDERCDCANCWKDISFWECYTSRMIHTDMGFWYPVCTDCYQIETIIL